MRWWRRRRRHEMSTWKMCSVKKYTNLQMLCGCIHNFFSLLLCCSVALLLWFSWEQFIFNSQLFKLHCMLPTPPTPQLTLISNWEKAKEKWKIIFHESEIFIFFSFREKNKDGDLFLLSSHNDSSSSSSTLSIEWEFFYSRIYSREWIVSDSNCE